MASVGIEIRRRRFPTTHWPLVHSASAAAEAGDDLWQLGELLRQYLPALRAHLMYKWHLVADAADDLLQGFIADKMIEQNLVRRADPARGKFRSFLLTALDHYVSCAIQYEHARKRLPGRMLELAQEQAPGGLTPPPSTDVFDVAWARQVLASTLERMERECRHSGRMDLWEIFNCRIRLPILEQVQPLPYRELVERFGVQSPIQAANLLITAKRMFQRSLRSVVAQYVRGHSDIEQEIRDLIEILSQAGAEP